MIRKILPYWLLVFKLDLLISLLATFISAPLSPKGISFDLLFYIFILSYLSGGFLFGILYFEFSRKQEYYFYHNLGISKLRLIFTSYLFNLVLSMPLMIIATYARSI